MICHVFQTLVIREFSHGLYITSMDVRYFIGFNNLQLYIFEISKYPVKRIVTAMDLNFLLNHTTPNGPPPASPHTIAAPTPPRANTNYVAHRSGACNTGSDSRAQKPSLRTKYPKLAPAPAPAPASASASASACTANVPSTTFTGSYSTASNPQPRVPSPPHPWSSNTSAHPPLTGSGTSAKTSVGTSS
jgi:hypothetical protein